MTPIAESLRARTAEVDGCWRWTRYVRPDGYAITTRRVDGIVRAVYIHRYMYEQAVGPIPDGHDIDHRCHDPAVCTPGRSCPHRSCINPDHLKAVTRRENTLRSGSLTASYARKTHCKRGHEFTLENTAPTPRGRACRECGREKWRRWYAKNRKAAS